ncbi:MAG: hypothetical protein AVDCRST_MAG02-944, partial [uncultured Rubrobacteraceae bacterium]
ARRSPSGGSHPRGGERPTPRRPSWGPRPRFATLPVAALRPLLFGASL